MMVAGLGLRQRLRLDRIRRRSPRIRHPRWPPERVEAPARPHRKLCCPAARRGSVNGAWFPWGGIALETGRCSARRPVLASIRGTGRNPKAGASAERPERDPDGILRVVPLLRIRGFASRFLGEMVLRREPAGEFCSCGVVLYRLLLACALVFAPPAALFSWPQHWLCGRILCPASQPGGQTVSGPDRRPYFLRGRQRRPACPALRPSPSNGRPALQR